MKRWLLLVLLLLGCGAERRVVVVSLDGFRSDYASRNDTPTLDGFVRDGAHAERLIPPWPSQTFPGHATLASGVRPEVHGILNNRFYDRERGMFDYGNEGSWYDADPLWIHAERQGLRAHVYHWVGSTGPREGVEASAWVPFAKVPDDQRLGGILEWLRAPPAERPRLVMSYWGGCDKEGHEYGPDDPKTIACIAETDARLGRLRDGLKALPDPVTLLVVSDHGMMNTVGQVNPILALKGTGARVVVSGPIAHVFGTPEQIAAAEAAAAKVEHMEVRKPKDRHPTRTGDLVLVAETGWHFDSKQKEVIGPMSLPGHHGHDPEHPEMGAVFYAWGDGVRAGAAVAKAYAVDVAPTVCALLGIPPPPRAEGRVLTELIAP